MRGILLIRSIPGHEASICDRLQEREHLDKGQFREATSDQLIERFQMYYGPYDVCIEMKGGKLNDIGTGVIKIREEFKEDIVETVTLIEAG